MATEKIMTLHPEGKQGVNIDRFKYDQMKNAICEVLEKNDLLTFKALSLELSQRLSGKFDGSIMWYYTTVKLDLEARNIIERVGKSPHKLRLVK